MLGKEPKPCKGHSAVAINEDRILVIKKGATPDDCIWFLEVSIWRNKTLLTCDFVIFLFAKVFDLVIYF